MIRRVFIIVSKSKIGNYSRIDDFCIVSGKVIIGRNDHVTPQYFETGNEFNNY